MSNENGDEKAVPKAMLGWLIAPLAVLVALTVNYGLGFGLDLNMETMTPYAALALAAALGMAPRVLREQGIIDNVNNQVQSLLVLVISLAASEGIAMFSGSNLIGLLFFITMFGGYILDNHGRFEWNTVLIFNMVGFMSALAAAGYFIANQSFEFSIEGQTYDRTSAWQEAIGFIFFNVWTVITVLGMLAAVLLRGLVGPESEKGWFSYIPSSDGLWNRATLPLQIALAVWAMSHVAVLAYFNSLGDLDILAIWSEEAYHGYIGFWPAALTGVVALICAWMAAERWFTRALFIGSMWGLYIISSLYETGHWSSETFEESWAVWYWFGISFLLSVIIYWFATHERYGGWVNRESHEPSQARVFWSNHWAGLMTGLAFLVALVIRVQWYLVPSMNSYGLNDFDLTGGSDPWYMKRVVDYIIAEHAHLIFDADRNYPVGGINPRPPLFTWSLALVAMFIAPIMGVATTEAVWWSMLAMPAVFGALTVFPMAGIAKDNFGKGAGVIAAWLIVFMPTHVQKSTWGMADHDAFVLLFLTAAFMFYLRAVKAGGDDRLMRKTNASPSGILTAIGIVMKERRLASANAIAAGVCFAIVALGWKGFVYGPAIIFLAYFVQVAMNMFRRKDSTILTTLNLLMIGTIFLMVLPFYGHPQLDLILNSTGLQPLLFIFGFTLAIGWITTGFRDKPWLLVLGSLVTGGILFFVLLYVLQQLDISNAWEVLTTGSGYFTKNKIFGTIAEASAPSRGQLFASFGPIVFVLAIVMGILAIWDGIMKKQQTKLILGMWVLVAAYMAWSAGRFLFNAAPAMAVMSSWGIVTLWRASGASKMAREWRRMGIRTPGDRISNARKAVWKTPQFSAIFLVLIMIASQHATYGIDAAMPSTGQTESEMDATIYNIMPEILRWNELGFSLLNDEAYDEEGNSRWFLGSFGSGFNDQGWNLAYDWLAHQDTDQSYSDRPAFVSWWDYGFQALESGDHPSVSDNFQSGIPATGNMLLARNQDDLVAMFVWRLSEADLKISEMNDGERIHSNSFEQTLEKHLSSVQVAEFNELQIALDKSDVTDRVFSVTQANREIVLAEGYSLSNGMVDSNGDLLFKVYNSGIVVPCEPENENDSTSCNGDAFTSFSIANSTFNSHIRSAGDTEFNSTHYIVGDYWYTADLVDEFDSVSTKIHRANAGIALITQLLTSSLSSDEIHDLYADLMDNRVYTVQDYDGAPGEMITRDHEIRYFAVDNRLYPRGGRYNSEYSGGNPSGIFGAPTILSGQDFATFMDEVYETSRGDFRDEMTRDEFNEEARKDVINQQAGSDVEPLNLDDVRIDHTSAFFDTMLARAYVGYGADDLGFNSFEQPGQHFQQSGTPNSMMTNAVPMPGAMMNRFVIANWYDSEDQSKSIPQANTYVKILKYYPGLEIEGSVAMTDGQGLPNVRILIERDAFSGEDSTDLDQDTYWIPIGYTDADENGEWSYTVPAGRIRVSAFAGVFDDVNAKDSFKLGEYTEGLGDLTIPYNDDRQPNLITALLGRVANMSWMGEQTNNITGDMADRVSNFEGNFDIEVKSSGISGTVSWSGHSNFDGEPLENTTFILRNIWSLTDNYTISTTSGSFTSDEFRIVGPGEGEVLFDGEGTFDTQGSMGLVRGFTGNFTREISSGRTYTSEGSWTGVGELVGTLYDYTAPDCNQSEAEDGEMMDDMPTFQNETDVTILHDACLMVGETDKYLFISPINASGRVTAISTVTLVKQLVSETFEGTGVFVGEGTVSGTGLFSGAGTFSGEMVKPGSFYQSGLVPGIYNMIAQLPNGKEVLLPDPVEVELQPKTNLEMTMPGSIFNDTLYSDTLTDGEPTPMPGVIVEILDMELGEDSVISIETDEGGNISYGPISRGDYIWRVDADGDGWYEREVPFFVFDESTNVTFEFSIPTKRDVTITLGQGDSSLDLANRTVYFTNVLSSDLNPMVVNATSNETGIVFAELDMGDWIVSDEFDEDYVLWEELVIRDTDQNISMDYAISVWFNGTVYAVPTGLMDAEDINSPSDIPSESLEPASIVTVEARSGSILLSNRSDSSGNYSLRLPAGRTFHLTVESFFSSETYTGGMTFDDAEAVEDYTIYIQEAKLVRGKVWLNSATENATDWGEGVPGSEETEVIATSVDGLEWRTELTGLGDFSLHLQYGNWTFSVSNDMMKVEPVIIETENMSEEIALIAMPDPVSLTIYMFLDSSEDGVRENGTAIYPSFNLVPAGEFGTQINITSDDYDQLNGSITLEVDVGDYTFSITEDDARDENASDYRLRYNFAPGLELGLSNEGEPIEIAFDPMYLVSGEIDMESGFDMVNSTIWLTSVDSEDFVSMTTDENGTFAAYIAQGDWYVEVAPYEADSNETEIFRGLLSVDSNSTNRSDLSWQTQTAMLVVFQLQEGLTEVNLTTTRVTAVSLDGLGNVSLGPSDNDGMISEVLMPGSWTMSINRTDNLERWVLEEGTHNSDDEIINGSWSPSVVSVDKWVMVGGKVFWDLNADEIPSIGEGILNATVLINGGTIDENLTTDEEGVWSLFVPIRTNYTVDANKLGFGNQSYMMDNESVYMVNDTHESRDIMLSAGLVSVTGNVTDIADLGRLEGATITLIPVVGIERDSITMSTSYDNETLSWSADIEPGQWIVMVIGTDADENGGGVAVGLLNASVQDGASIDLDMAMGGRVSITTAWTTFDGVAKHAGDAEDARISIDLGDEMEWYADVDDAGKLDLVLPSGTVDLSSEFSTVQHDMELNMEYTAGIQVNNEVGLDSREMAFDRRENSDLTIEIVSINGDSAIFDESDLTEMSAISADDNSYTTIEMTLNLQYDGTEIEDTFTVVGSITVAQDSADWQVVFKNSTGEWVQSTMITMGVGDDNASDNHILSTSVDVRIIMPLQNESRSYDDGHAVNMKFSTEYGESELSVRVNIPQVHSISMTATDSNIGIADGSTAVVGVALTNNGNGDDTMTITPSLSDDCSTDGWAVTPITENRTVGPDVTLTQSFTVKAPSNGSITTCSVSFSVSSEGTHDTLTGATEVVISVASLSFDTNGFRPLEADAAANEAGTIRIAVKNDGFLTASDVIVTLVGTADTEFEQQQVTITVPAQGSAYAEFSYDEFNTGKQRFEVRMESIGTPTDSTDDDLQEYFDIRFSSMSEGEESSYVLLIVVLLGAAVLFGGYKVARKGSSSRF
ncbi:MAG TPA: hypothetical protein EYQ73_07900 [Candidatus Poseidoniales archaeon]|nr:hypothetical protein [Candidatus Poseidoniales archaeon]